MKLTKIYIVLPKFHHQRYRLIPLYLALKKLIIWREYTFCLALVLFVSCDNDKKSEEEIGFLWPKNWGGYKGLCWGERFNRTYGVIQAFYVIEEEVNREPKAVATSMLQWLYKGYFLNGLCFWSKWFWRNLFWTEPGNKRLQKELPYFKEGGNWFAFGACNTLGIMAVGIIMDTCVDLY